MKLTKYQYKRILENNIPFIIKRDDDTGENFVIPNDLETAYVDFFENGERLKALTNFTDNNYTPFVLDWFPEHDEYFLSNTPIYKLKNFLKNNK